MISPFPAARPLAGGLGPRPVTPDVRLTTVGRRFLRDGVAFRWRGVTAFRIVDRVARGDITGASAFLRWAREAGFNLVRVLSTAKNDFMDLTPAAGRAALPAALDLIAAHGLYAEVVGLSDTAERSFAWRDHARAVAEIASARPNAVFEYANEPGHDTHVDELHDMAHVDDLARESTAGLPGLLWAAGTGFDDESPLPGGRYATRHLDRGRDLLNQVRRVRELLKVVEATGTQVVNDEPLGAAEPGTPGQRCWEPWFFYAMGALEALFGIDGTFHLQSGLSCDVPGPVEQACAKAYIAGSLMLPDGTRWSYRNSRHAGSPVVQIQPEEADPEEPETPGGGPTVRAYSAIDGAGRGLTVVLQRPDAFVREGVTFGNGYHPVDVHQPYPHVTVIAVSQ